MRRSLCTAFLAASWSLLPAGTYADSSRIAADARMLLERHEPATAAELLEDALPQAGSSRPELLGLLRRAYAEAARQADAAGKTRAADAYRDNLEILNRRAATKPTAVSSPSASPAPLDPSLTRASSPKEATVPLGDTPLSAPAKEEPAGLKAVPGPGPEERGEPAAEAGGPAAVPAASAPEVSVAKADAAFVAKTYDEAGRLYAALDRENRLPASRKDHWAYCRWVDVVRRIEAGPKTQEEWSSIDAEIKKTRELSPKNWFGEYLRSRAAERKTGARAIKSSQIVVRGSAPEEDAGTVAGRAGGAHPGPAGARPATTKAEAKPAAEPSRAATPAAGASGRKTVSTGSWQIRETASFRIMHEDPELAEKVAQIAEAVRAHQTKRWTDSIPHGPWSPRCDIYLYPTAKTYSQMTGQPQDSPGFSTMGMNGGRIVARRVNLRVDHPNLLAAILPHEVTHVVLADLFPYQQIPRWADEGMAVLSEPRSEQGLRAADLEKPLSNGQLFKLEDLMVMDYPDGRYWGLYYAQSVSLTRFLVEQSSPAKFVEFVQKAQRNGTQAELRRIYGIESFSDLQRRWLAFARSQTSTMTASSEKTVKDGATESLKASR